MLLSNPRKLSSATKNELMEGLGFTAEQADIIRKLMQNDVDGALSKADTYMAGFGIEAIRGKWVDNYYGDIVGLYVNTGDTYNTTLLYDTIKERFYVTTMGDFVEKNERKYEIR